MNNVTRALNIWLATNNIDPGKVRVVLKFPTLVEAERARASICREVDLLTSPYMARPAGDIRTMNGIGLTLTWGG